MSLETDLLLERRRVKRRLGLWRALAVALALLGGAALLGPALLGPALLGGGHVARLSLRGFIGDDPRLLRALAAAAEDADIRAVIVAIDSPGGSVAGGEALHAAIARLREAGKPVAAVMGGTAASAGYMVALPAQRIFAREATLTGSIGVILQSFEASELLARLGVRAETLASGPLKDQPSPFRPLTEEGRAALAAVIADMQAQFVAKVVHGRGMEEAQVRAVADGRVLSGRQALALGLVDAIGGEREARRWLAEAHGVDEDLPVEELDARPRAQRLLDAAAAAAWRAGLQALAPLALPR
ncbi:signal peptide peptidase SppA [Roseococcus sp. DSY-14]|uniref:signal peptide peptidase SppA n=1 Tax=Roseococcus sp. DSY-14 TaxID=3369650 RepID=UPI00387B63DE